MTMILAVVQSDSLRVELEAAASAMGSPTTVSFCADLPTAFAFLRHDHPDALMIELSGDADSIRDWQPLLDVQVIPCPIIGVLDDDAQGASAVLVEAVRAGFRDFIRRPASSGEIASALRRVDRVGRVGSRRGKMLAVASTKGGVGKSTIAVNTAVYWARTTDSRVLLVDASLQLGVASSLLNLTPSVTIADVAAAKDRLDATLLREMASIHDSGLSVLPAPFTPGDAADVDEAAISIILGVAKSAYDYVIVDSFPLLDSVTLSILDRSEHVCVVTENVVPTLTGTAAMLRTLDQLEIGPRRRTLVLNRFQSYAGSLSASDVARQLGEPIAAVIPQDRRVVEAANLGTPIVERRSLWGSSKSFVRLSNNLLQRLNEDKHADRAAKSDELTADSAPATFATGVAANVS